MDDRQPRQEDHQQLLLDYVRGLKKPLLFVARDEYAHLGSVKGLDKTVLAVVERAMDLNLKSTQKELLREIRLQFLEYDSMETEERRHAIDSTLSYLRTLERQLAGIGEAARAATPPERVPASAAQDREPRRGRNPETSAGQANRAQAVPQGKSPQSEGKGRPPQGRPGVRTTVPDNQARDGRRAQHYRESGGGDHGEAKEAELLTTGPRGPVQVTEETRGRTEERSAGRPADGRESRAERDPRENRDARGGGKDSSRNRDRDRARLSTAHPRNREGARESQTGGRDRGAEGTHTELRAERERTRPLAEYHERSDQDLNWGRVRRLPVAQLELVPYIVPELRDDDTTEEVQEEPNTSVGSRKQEKFRGKQRHERRGGPERGPRGNEPHQQRGGGGGDERIAGSPRSPAESSPSPDVAIASGGGNLAGESDFVETSGIDETRSAHRQILSESRSRNYSEHSDERHETSEQVLDLDDEFEHIEDTDDTTIELEVSAVNRLYGRTVEPIDEIVISAYHSGDLGPVVSDSQQSDRDTIRYAGEAQSEGALVGEDDADNIENSPEEPDLEDELDLGNSLSGYHEPAPAPDLEDHDSDFAATDSERLLKEEGQDEFGDEENGQSFDEPFETEALIYEHEDATDPLVFEDMEAPGAFGEASIPGDELTDLQAPPDEERRQAALGAEAFGAGQGEAPSNLPRDPDEFNNDARLRTTSAASPAGGEPQLVSGLSASDETFFEDGDEVQGGEFEDGGELEPGGTDSGTDEDDGEDEESAAGGAGIGDEEGRRRGRRRRRRRRGSSREATSEGTTDSEVRPQLDPAQSELMAARLNSPLAELKGVGPKLGAILEQQGLRTVRDAIHFLPTSYQDRRAIRSIAEIQPGEACIISGVIDSSELVNDDRLRHLIVQLSDGAATVKAVWPNVRSNYLKNRFRTGASLLLWGTLEEHDGAPAFLSPETELVGSGDDDESLNSGRIVPVYPSLEGIGQKTLRRMIHQALSLVKGGVPDPVPAPVRARNQLMSVEQALWAIHFPSSEGDFEKLANGTTEAHQALAFQELFVLELALAHRRKVLANESGHAMKVLHGKMARLLKSLPPLTDDQRAVLEDIKRDMGSPHPMMRLLQADVGTGSLQVATLAIGLALDNDSQVAVFAASEGMVEQQAAILRQLLKPLKVEVEAITTSVRGRVREKLVHRLRKGEIQVVVGTHALFQEGIAFKKLGLAIIDEQQRAGLIQRRNFLRRGVNPDILVLMSAPVPQELLYSIYGDMTWSYLRGQVEDRPPIETRVVVNENRDEIETLIRTELGRGQQLFYISPGREEGDKNVQRVSDIALRLKDEVFPGISVGYLHSRMTTAEQEQVIQNFRTRQIQIVVTSTETETRLVSPRASVMIIDRAECQPSVQLHVLRGRLLDSYQPAYCFMVPGPEATQEELDRLHVLERSQDGFELAEMDYRKRSPEDYLGVRQAGLTKLWVADMVAHSTLLSDARREAFRWVDDSPEATDEAVNKTLSSLIKQRWSGLVEGIPLP